MTRHHVAGSAGAAGSTVARHLTEGSSDLHDALFVKETERVLYVVSERWDALEPHPLIKAPKGKEKKYQEPLWI
jgi:hypothetical protein